MTASLYKIVIVDHGKAGETTQGALIAYVCALVDFPVEIIIVNEDEDLASSQADDLIDASINSKTFIRCGRLGDPLHCEMLIITLGSFTSTEDSREQLLINNAAKLKGVFTKLNPLPEGCIVLIVGTPNEALTELAWHLSGLPTEQVFGMGTSLKASRLKQQLSQTLKVSPCSVDVSILGESGGIETIAWHSATVGPIKLLQHPSMSLPMEVGPCSEKHYFALARCVASVVESILHDKMMVYPVSVYSDQYRSYVSWPASLGHRGIKSLIQLTTTSEEQERLHKAVMSIRSDFNRISSGKSRTQLQ